MAKDRDRTLDEKLDTVISLLRHLVALQLAERGVTQRAIAKHLHASKSTVVEMLKGIKDDG